MATKADQSCFDDGVLLTVHGTGLTRYDINGNQQSEYHFKLDKPRDVTCTQCILQWKYNAGLHKTNRPLDVKLTGDATARRLVSNQQTRHVGTTLAYIVKRRVL